MQRRDLTPLRSLLATGVLTASSFVDAAGRVANAAPPEAKPQVASQAPPPPQAPLALQLQADRQYYDGDLDLVVAAGNVKARINGGLLQADRIEFDTGFETFAARGSVRFRRGSQYFQASSLRFSLIHNEGVLEDVYGVLDLDSAALDLTPTNGGNSAAPEASEQPQATLESSGLGFATAQQIELDSQRGAQISPPETGSSLWRSNRNESQEWLIPVPVQTASHQDPGMACPPMLPPVPEWHPHPWAATLWGGQSIDSNFGDTFLFNGRIRPEYLGGLTLQKRIWKAGPLALELEGNLFAHQAYSQAGGAFNQATPFADTPSQSFGEGIVGLGARFWLQPWLSFGVVEGVSYFTSNSNYERTYRENYAQLLNYLGFELEAAVSQQLSLVGRIHHRSGAFGTYSGVREGSNAYLIGARYRWGRDAEPSPKAVIPPPLGCPDPDRATRAKAQSLNEELDAITLGPANIPTTEEPSSSAPLTTTADSRLTLSEQEALRAEAIARIDQRIDSIQLQQRFKIERQQGIPKGLNTKAVEAEREYGDVRVQQLKQVSKEAFITGEISRWRIQAARVELKADGWRADRMGFTNDPFTPAQTRIDAENVVASQDDNGDLVIQTSRNQLIVEERLALPVSRNQRIRKEEEVENRWVFGIDRRIATASSSGAISSRSS